MAATHGDQTRFKRNILITLALGVVFVVGVGIEWKEAFVHFPPTTGFVPLFFTMTGVHAFHVINGLIALAFIYGMGRNGRYGKGSYWGGDGSVKCWHFVDVAWVYIYPVLYLVN